VALRICAPATEHTRTPAATAAKKWNFDIIPWFLLIQMRLQLPRLQLCVHGTWIARAQHTALCTLLNLLSILTQFDHEYARSATENTGRFIVNGTASTRPSSLAGGGFCIGCPS
jgi:hypothetical protein